METLPEYEPRIWRLSEVLNLVLKDVEIEVEAKAMTQAEAQAVVDKVDRLEDDS